MIHDALLSCLNLSSSRLPIEEFVVSDAVSEFLHPCEKKILEDITSIVNILRDLQKFTKFYGNNSFVSNAATIETDAFTKWFVSQSLCQWCGYSIEDVCAEISELERSYLQNPNQSLMFIYNKLQIFEPMLIYIKKLIRHIRLQKLHGCMILQYLHQNSQHGDKSICKAMKTIHAAVNVVFLKQLTHWVLYAKIVDTYGEFFIQTAESREINSTLESDKGNSIGSGKHTTTTMSEAASTYGDIWSYEIFYDFLPHYLTSNWAEKVFFIGQTVLIFKYDSNQYSNSAHSWNKTHRNILEGENSLWKENEHIYFNKIQSLQNDTELNVSHYERVIDEIKNFVTTRLSEIAINQADLVQQLRLIKDYYLLGRGELYLEFIRQTYLIGKDETIENKLRDFVKAFETSAHSVGVSEDLEQFSLCIPKSSSLDAEDFNDFGYLQHMQLSYKINWPLHLLFSPKALDRYNQVFRFLLLIKRMQYELHMLWCTQTRQSKLQKSQNLHVMQLRNQLMFFIDNLQYYIQVDVLESQFSILLTAILSKADFEQIQRSHTVFQANILSLCFLLSNEDINRASTFLQSTILYSNHPVYIVLNDIFHLCEDFCALVTNEANMEAEKFNKDIQSLDERFVELMEQLIDLLTGLKASPSTTSLSQLLLRLDFNHWFSSKKKLIVS